MKRRGTTKNQMNDLRFVSFPFFPLFFTSVHLSPFLSLPFFFFCSTRFVGVCSNLSSGDEKRIYPIVVRSPSVSIAFPTDRICTHTHTQHFQRLLYAKCRILCNGGIASRTELTKAKEKKKCDGWRRNSVCKCSLILPTAICSLGAVVQIMLNVFVNSTACV